MASRQTFVKGGDGSSTLEYALAPGVFQYIQSILVVVDNTAGPDVNPILTVQTVNGTPIADKTQGTAIPAGDTGRATWALRLTDETAAGGAVTLPGYGTYECVAQSVASGGAVNLNWTYVSGDAWLDLSTANRPLIVTEGIYGFTMCFTVDSVPPAGKFWFANLIWDQLGDLLPLVDKRSLDVPAGFGRSTIPIAGVRYCAVGAQFRAGVVHNSGVNVSFGFKCFVQKLA